MSELIGVMMIGLKGAVATTLVSAGIAARYQLASSLSLPSERDEILSRLSLTPLSDMRFGGWDISAVSFADSLAHHKVLPPEMINRLTPHLDEVWECPGVSLSSTPIHGEVDTSVRTPMGKTSLRDLTDALRQDIQSFRATAGVDQVVILDLSSTAPTLEDHPAHHDLSELERLLDAPLTTGEGEGRELGLSAGNLYAYAAISEGCACVNFTPSTTFDIPALIQLAEEKRVPLCGKDGKTGQTLYKTVLAPLFRQRALKVNGWYSTNILGNRDGEVLDHPEHRQTKIESKSRVLNDILGDDELDHQVHIHYYKPRGDAKEAWDNIDFEGWFGVPMQMKINWLGSDSILAAPLAADLVRWVIYFQRRGEGGVIRELASYFKSPLQFAEHDFFKQVQALRDHISSHLG